MCRFQTKKLILHSLLALFHVLGDEIDIPKQTYMTPCPHYIFMIIIAYRSTSHHHNHDITNSLQRFNYKCERDLKILN